MRRSSSSWLGLLGFGGVVAASALVGALAQRRGREWYHGLEKPSFTPPDWLFAPVWTGLYTLMAGSAWRVWRSRRSRARSRALALWGAQLAANAAWTPLFFGARRPGWALADLALLVAGAGAYANQARKVDRAAAWMMAPYLLWRAFAGVLNEEIARRNAPRSLAWALARSPVLRGRRRPRA